MKRVKGCLNSSCTEYRKTYYKESDEYCSKCGSKLCYVCKYPKCFKQLPDNSKENICEFHIAEKKDKKDKLNKTFERIGEGVAATVVVVAGAIKLIGDITKKE